MEAEGKDAAEVGGEWGIDFENAKPRCFAARRPGFLPWPRDAYAASDQQDLIDFRGFPERCRRPQG